MTLIGTQNTRASTWNGGGPDANWTDALNWDSLPTAGSPLAFDGTVQLTNNNDNTAGTVFAGITFNSTAGSFILNGNALSPGGDIVDNSTNLQTINLPLVLTASNNITVTSGGQLAIGGIISDGGAGFGFTANGPGILTLSGANSYAGKTAINAGALVLAAGGTLGNGSSALTMGNGTNTSSLDLTNSSANVASFTVSSNSTTADTLLIGAGKTLTTTGNVAIGLSGNATTTNFTASGSGTFTAGSNAGGFFVAGNTANGNSPATASNTTDFSGLANVNLNYLGGIIGVGTSLTGLTANGVFGNLTLGANNNLTASTLNIALNNGGGNVGQATLKLGTTNTIAVDTIAVGQGKTGTAGALGSIIFNTGLTNPTVTIHGTAGPTARVNSWIVADYSELTASSSTGQTSSVDFTAGTLNALVNNLTVGIGKATTGAGTTTGVFSFSAGTLDVNNLLLAVQGTSNTANANVTATMNVSGTATLNINSAFTLGTKPLTPPATATVTGILNVTGGTVTSNVDILRGTGTANVTLNGGILDLTDHNLGGSGTATISNLTLASGTLRNVLQYNAGANLTKTTAGSLTIDGVNTFTGNLAVSAGTLNVIGSLPAAGNVSLANTSTLTGAGNGTTIGVLGNVSMAAGSTISPGTTLGATGTLTLSGLTVTGGNFTFDLGTGLGNNDRINVNGNANFSAATTFNVGAATTAGVYTLLSTTGTLTLAPLPSLIDTDATFQYVLDTTSNPKAILLDVNTVGAILTWSGAADHTTWDNTKANFFNGTNNQAFSGISPVIFDDSAPATALNVNLTIAATPATVTISANSNNYTLSGTGSITGGGNLTMNGSSTFTIANANTYTGATTINNGSLAIAATGSITSSSVVVNSPGTLSVAVGGNISAATTLTDNGTVILNNPTSTIATLLGSGTLTLNSTALTLTAGGNFTGTIQGTGGPVVTGGTLVLSGTNTYFGTTTINGGTLSVAADSSLGDLSSNISMNGGTLTVSGTADTSTNRSINLSAGGGTINISNVANTFTLNSAIAGAGAFMKGGTGSLIFTVPSSYQGGTVLAAGTLSISDDSFLGNASGPLTFTGGTLLITGTTATTTTRTISLASGVGTFNINDPGNTFTISTALTGPGGLGKSGPGTLILSVANNYTGATSVNAGSLIVSAGNIGTGALSLGNTAAATSGTLDLTGATNSVNVASLTSAGNTTTPSTIILHAGQTLAVAGNVIVGGLTGNGTNTALTITGSSASFTAGSGAPGLFIVGNQANGNSPNTASGILDLSQVSTVNINYGSGASSILGIGTTAAGLNANAPFGSLILGTNNTIVVGNILMGLNNGGGNAGNTTFLLGQTNDIGVDNIDIGSGKSQSVIASMNFNPSLTSPTLTLHGTAGPTSRVGNFTIADGSLYNASSGTATNSIVDFSNGTVNALINNLTLAVGKALTNNAASNATLTYTAGTIDATTITLGIQGTSTTAGANATANLNVNGNATLIAGAGGIILGSKPLAPPATATITGNLTINGGTVTSNADIIDGGGTSNITLNGGILDLTGHNLGTAAGLIDNLNIESGTLQNVAEINAGAPLNFSSGGIVTFAGTNTSVAPISLNAGQLIVSGSITSPNITVNSGTNMTVAAGGKLGASPALTVNGSVVIAAATPHTLTTLSSLSIAGSYGGSASAASTWTGSLDLNDSKLIIEDTSATRAADLAQIQNEAFAANTTGNVGIFSSTVNAFNAAAGKVVKVVVVSDNAVRMATFPSGSSNFGGTNNVDASSILVTAAFKGDANLDGVVDIQDLTDVANHWQQAVTDWSQGDFDGSDFVDIQDLTAVANNWQDGVGGGGGSSFNDALADLGGFSHNNAVPEPTSLTLLGLGGLFLTKRRRRI